MESSIIRNGCGGTERHMVRQRYCERQAALMETIGKKYKKENLRKAFLLDVSSNGVKVSEIKFQWRYVVAVWMYG